MLIVGLGALLAAMPGAIGCGDDDGSTTTQAGAEPAAIQGPVDPLTSHAIGPVEIGMSQDEVRELIGGSEETEEVNLGASPEAPQVNWIWDMGDGAVALEFDNVHDALAGYRVSSSELSTSDGISVGDPIEPIQARLGDRLTPAPFGNGLVLSEGKPGTAPALVFTPGDGEVIEIRGGSIIQPAGE